MKWVLILIATVHGGWSYGPLPVVFSTQETCQVALKALTNPEKELGRWFPPDPPVPGAYWSVCVEVKP